MDFSRSTPSRSPALPDRRNRASLLPTSAHNPDLLHLMNQRVSVDMVAYVASKATSVIVIGDETETFDPARHKDIGADQLTNLRRFLRKAGYAPGEVPA